MRRLIDISLTLGGDTPLDFGRFGSIIHGNPTSDDDPAVFWGATADDPPEGEGWAAGRSSVIGDSMLPEGPHHYASMMDSGNQDLTIAQVPLDWCFQPGIKLDLRHLPDGAVATPKDIEAGLERIDHTLSPLEIVLVNTRAGKRYGDVDYATAGCAIGRDATTYLLERGIRVTGTDAAGWDPPVGSTAPFGTDGRQSINQVPNAAGQVTGFCHLEKLGNLESLPAKGFTVSCFPVKVSASYVGWTRAVAILD